MTPYPLVTLADVILYQLQRTNLNPGAPAGILSFSELWEIATCAARHVTPPLRSPNPNRSNDPDEKRAVAAFARSILSAVDKLVELGYVAKLVKPGTERLDLINLTTAGTDFIASVIFTDQGKAGLYVPKKKQGKYAQGRPYARRRGSSNYPTKY